MKICRLHMMLQIIVIFIASLLLVAMPTNAQTQSAGIKVDQNFDHSRTKFPLEGAHKTVTCEKCHEGAIFKGVPTACANCHNDDFSKGKGNNHPKTSNECANCHNNTKWAEVHVDHSKINTGCFTCHDGKIATGKSKTHVKSSKTCEDCHIVTTWRIAKFDHTLTVEPCESCHDRLHATGKPFVHIRSSNECATCHISTSWKIGVFDHTGIVDGCFTCHDGVTATGKSKNHLTTSNDCQNCHNTFNWTSVKFDHTDPAVAGVVCLTCHDGNIAAGKAITHYRTSTDCASCHTTVSWAPAGFDHASALFVDKCIACHDNKHLTSKGTAIGKNQNHLTTANSCGDCHKSYNTWKLTASKDFDHTLIFAPCLSCHDGAHTISTGPIVGKSNKHMPTTNTCDVCHDKTQKSFVPNSAFNHGEVTVSTCFSCHDGIQTVSTAGKMIGKIQGHVAAGNNCELCHASFTTWKTSTFDHSVIGATPCATCHDGVSALGTKDAPAPGHLTFTATDCGSCHTNFISFKPSKFDHTFASTNCVTCHDGVRKISNPKAMVGQNSFPNHIPTNGQVCGDCHTSFTTWKTTFNHVGANGTCFSCHNGTTATGKLTGPSGKHILTSDTCENCHVNTTWVVASAKFDHNDPMVTPGQACFQCHNGVVATGKLSISGKHPTTSDNCGACHVTIAWTVAAGKFDHSDPLVQGVACETCHNGITAIGKSKAHILTLNTCASCHPVPTNWLVAVNKVEHLAVIGTCFSCHDKSHSTPSFAPISYKPGTHLLTSNLCASCHETTLWNPVAANKVDHSQVLGTCFSCHDGVKATGRTIGTHVTASTDCVLCHDTIAWTGGNVKFDHTDPDVAGASCVSCHNGSIPSAFSKASAAPPHILSSDDCSNCHTTVAFKPAHVDHTDPTVVAQACSACHNGVTATGKIPGHIPTPPPSDCKDCHSTQTFVTNAKPDHTKLVDPCSTCHNNVRAKGKTPTHFVTSNTCDLCHSTTLFKPATFDHNDTAVAGVACFTCHDGAPNHAPAMGKSSAPGGHLPTSNSCENCHKGFTNWVWNIAIKFPHDDTTVMQTVCSTCHDGNHAPAVGRLPTHFQTSTDCGSCHVTTAWTVGVGKFNHADPVSAGVPCFTCHNGTKLPAVGKIQGHVASSNLCGDCHSTLAWKPAKFDHVNVVPGTCFTCHNGTRATGKSNTHFVTSNTCDNCHNTVKWVPALSPFNHADTVVAGAKCYSCHSGAKPPAVTKSNKHIASTTACETCHVTSSWTVALNGVDHAQVIGACFSCHNGTFATPSRTITPKSPKHFTTTNTCDACHTTAAWKPVAPTAFDHTQATGTCNSCHDGTHAPAVGKTPTHIKSTVLCDACHTTITWKPVAANKVDHTQVIGTCFTCHNGTIAQGKGLTHIKTSTTCDACHNTVTWVSITIDHTQTVGTCFTCHNATIATGKTTFGKHFNTSNTCELCHSSKDTKIPAAANWMVVKTAFDHTDPVVMASACATCHTATATPAAADVKSPTHFITTQPCQVCHNTVNWTTLATYSHTSPAYVAHSVSSGVTTCLSCHKQNNEKITYLQPGLFPDCASCHSDKYKPDPHNKYGNVRYTFTELRDCTGACHIYKDATMTTILTTRTTNTKHRPTRSSWN